MGKKSFPEKLKNFFSLNGSLNTSKGTQTRVAVAKIAFSAVMVLLVGHMAILQFVRGEELQEDAYNLHHRGKTISAARGNIYDRNGTPLAVTVSANTITANANAAIPVIILFICHLTYISLSSRSLPWFPESDFQK